MIDKKLDGACEAFQTWQLIRFGPFGRQHHGMLHLAGERQADLELHEPATLKKFTCFEPFKLILLFIGAIAAAIEGKYATMMVAKIVVKNQTICNSDLIQRLLSHLSFQT
ncbi:hypothetical protein CORC01_04446 [Colletotrichum orchidophilum]|uniref:Uncharacterized protein n=1 Tax=Colletotrichum orchidophilum TaxID=1209926 RepID=A0A1G4BG12_9PEZI|nr:uncharacterized protein CORC01_04446 [Colletotrichum orchidophilum]OHF00257.1 hypothetical protein CORC01_04446 [Colletotrichum orchidophilum]